MINLVFTFPFFFYHYHKHTHGCGCGGNCKDEVLPEAHALVVLVGMNMAVGEGGISTWLWSSKVTISKFSKANAPTSKFSSSG